MTAVYQGLFWFGVLYAAAGFILGHLGEITGMGPPDAGAEVPGADGTDMEAAGDAGVHPSPLKPIIIASFLIVFGGTGMMAEALGWRFGFTLAAALILAFLVATVLFRFVVAPLYRLQNTSAATRDQLIGLAALVTTPIYENGFGTISYRFKENIYNAPARSLTGKPVAQGEKVVIVKLEGKAFIVHIAEEYSNKYNK